MPGPLAGLGILDFTALLPGPYATMVLADLGARVVRVASAARPDLTAFMPPMVEEGLSHAQAFLGRSKRSMLLNLKHERAPSVVDRLLETHDILIEQFRPGVMDRLGLGHERLCAAHPELIYCSLTGYGQTGPLAGRAGHDINYLARSGLMHYSGRAENGPALTGMQIADLAAGSMNTVTAVLAAVIERQKSGLGQRLDISMLDGCLALNALAGSAMLAGGPEPEREKGLLNGGSLYDFYETKDGRHMSLGALETKFFEEFCQGADCAFLAPGGVMPGDTQKAKETLKRVIAQKTQAQWVELFKKQDACFEPVLGLGQALEDETIRQRGMVVELELPGGRRVRQLASPLRFSRTPPEYARAGEPAGTHTRQVLGQAGYAEDEITEMEKDGLLN